MREFVICIPARNEAAHIQETVLRLSRALVPIQQSDWKIVVVENGPQDGTKEIIKNLADPRIEAIRYDGKEGKGEAIKFAAQKFETDFFGFIDADLSADPDAIPGMLALVVQGRADAVIGSRLMQTRTTNRGWLRTLSSRLFNLVAKIILDLKVKDSQCGLKIMNARAREILASCQEGGWFFDMEFLARLRKYEMSIIEVPVPWIEFRYPDRKSQVNAFKDGLVSIAAMLRIKKRLTADK